jgi:TrkA-N domain/RyR domain
VGFAQLLAPGDPFGPKRWDIAYDDMQLFVLGSPPLDNGGPFPVALEFARFAAPMVTIYAVVEASRLIFAAELRRLRTRRARGHAIVCGQTVLAATIARRLRSAGERVVLVQEVEPSLPRRPRRGMWVVGDASDPDVLRAAGVQRASSLYACTHDSATNTAIALAAGRRRHAAHGLLRVYAEISDPDLCLTLQARYLGPPVAGRTQLDFFHADLVGARKLCLDRPLGELSGPPPRVLIAGMSTFGSALVVELARYWLGRAIHPLPRLPVMLVDPVATLSLRRLSDRYPFLADVCEFEVHDRNLYSLLDNLELDDSPDRMFICDDDEERVLKSALVAERLRRNPSREIVVRLDRLAELQDLFEEGGLGERFDQFTTRLRIFGATQAAGDPALIQRDLVERLARVVHDTYLRAELSNPDRGDRASLQPWESLPEALRAANRAQAEDFGRKLRLVGCTLVPRVGPTREHELTEPEIELLAQDEHQRWHADRLGRGWTFAPELDEAHRTHPGMVAWEELPDQLREPNFRAIRAMPGILAQAGFRIARL